MKESDISRLETKLRRSTEKLEKKLTLAKELDNSIKKLDRFITYLTSEKKLHRMSLGLWMEEWADSISIVNIESMLEAPDIKQQVLELITLIWSTKKRELEKL